MMHGLGGGRTTGALLQRRVAQAGSGTVNVHRLLQEGQDVAGTAFDTASENVPSGWSDISNNLQSAAITLKSAYVDANKYLDSGEPSRLAKAMDEASDVQSYLAQAMSAARDSYVEQGRTGGRRPLPLVRITPVGLTASIAALRFC